MRDHHGQPDLLLFLMLATPSGKHCGSNLLGRLLFVAFLLYVGLHTWAGWLLISAFLLYRFIKWQDTEHARLPLRAHGARTAHSRKIA